jgi:hypothetical protein
MPVEAPAAWICAPSGRIPAVGYAPHRFHAIIKDSTTHQGTTSTAGNSFGRGAGMAAMKPRTGDGPLEVTKEGRGIVMRVPLEGGGRLVVELSADEAAALGDALKNVG